ncbi:MAG: hypothetical protein ABH806_00595 [Candidatus Omnitrophota bacterium]
MLKPGKNILIILLFFIIASIFTYPLALKMDKAIPGFGSTDEPFAVISNMWLVKYSSQRGIDLKNNDYIAYPFGVDLTAYWGSSYLWEYLKNTLSFITSHIVAFNILIFMSFILSGWFTYLLVYRLTGSAVAGIFSGAIFSLCPYHFARVWQHLALSQIQWMPLYLLSLLSFKDKPVPRNIFFVAVSLFLVVSFNFYYAYFMAVASALFVVFIIKENGIRRAAFNYISKLFLAYLIVLVMIAPNLWEVYKYKNSSRRDIPLEHNIAQRPFDDLFSQSARPLSYILPSSEHPLFGGIARIFLGSKLYGESLTEHALYLGWIPLILAFMVYRKCRKDAHKLKYKKDVFCLDFFVWLAVISWLFSQPPWWQIGPFRVYMPSFFMYKALPMFRAYCRFGVVLMLAVAVLAGFGLRYLLERYNNKALKGVLVTVVFGMLFFEFLNFPPLKVIELDNSPAVYEWLSKQKGDFAVAEYPLDYQSQNVYYLFYQTVHRKKIINASNPGTYASSVAKLIRTLSDPDTVKILNWMGVKYVIVHRDDYINTGLIDEIDEAKKISFNPLLKFVRSFPDTDLYAINTREKLDPETLLRSP